ncbi:MAG: dienelactone hydrolase [Okeania sp. SIO3I5]|uniref:alpha/beta hydrolase family protein n=1 Tax=Okeania sp. SIO3I5 TaxID=2607805 RepID=UPI0013BC6064|nr:dienelactone hydrolase [Okeania sp. SIO3I5]NEQ36853.1 dienelactone hydrolase [Okeania sp. SIO3I5]
MNIRAFYRATKVENAQPPYDTIHLKVFYPGKISEGEIDMNQEMMPVDSQHAPFPVVIFLSGFNCHPQMYEWLAVKLSERGLVVVTFSWVEESFPGKVNMTPGINFQLWKPDNYGTGSTSSTLPTIILELERLNSEGILAGMLDLEKIILGGHSAGGRIAMENADPRFYPQVAAAFAYGTTSVAPVILGHELGKILPLADSQPLLLIGGTCDGVVAKMNVYNGFPENATIGVEETFAQAISGGRDDSYLLLLEGANHFTISDPFDPTTARPFLDFPATKPEDEIRSLMAETIGLFIDAHVRQQSIAFDQLKELLNNSHPLIKSFERK